MEEQKNNKFILGIIGAIIGAFVGTIPWLLIYIFGNYIVALLSIFIAVGSYQGYKITRATMDKKLPVIVALTSIIAITITNLFIAPLIMLAKEDIGANIENLELIYQDSEFKAAMMHDYIISLLFTIFGISGIVANLNKQIKAGATRDEIKLNISNQTLAVTPEEMQAIKDIFVKNDALNKNNTLTKEEVIQDLSTQITETRANEVFTTLKTQQIIRKSGGKFYFSEKAQNSNLYRNGKALGITFGVIAILIILMVVVIAVSDNSDSKSKKNNTNNSLNSSISQNSNTNTSKNNNSLDNSSTTSDDDESLDDEEYETEHVISSTKIKFVPKDDLLILTDKEIETYFGSSYTEYEFVALNQEGSKMLYCFIDDNEDMKDKSAKEYLESTLESSEHTEIETKNIKGFEFETTKMSFEQGDEKYEEECYVYKHDDKFVCFDYCYLEGENGHFDEMIQTK